MKTVFRFKVMVTGSRGTLEERQMAIEGYFDIN